MHGHTTELVTNLFLPGWFDLRSVAKSKSGESPLNSIDIIDGDDYDCHDAVGRLRGSIQHPDLQQLVLSDIEMDEHVIDALMDLLRSGRQWDALYLEFCEGDLDKTIKSVLKLENVKKLEIAGNVNARCIQTLSTGLTMNKSLKELALLATLDEQNADTLIDGLNGNVGLQSLKFIKSTLEPSSIKSIANFLRKDGRFETIHFDRCIVADDDIATLVTSLKDHSILKELYVGGNFCEDNMRPALSNLIIQNTLQELSLHSQKQISRYTRVETLWMVPALHVNYSLKVLDLSENGLDDDGLQGLVDAFCSNSSLEEVRLHENHITNKGAQLFGSRIRDMRGLKRIFLHRNRFDEVGARDILEGIRNSDGIVEELTIPAMDPNKKMSKYQRLISYETCLNSGGKQLRRDNRIFPLALWPLVFERAGWQLWTPYCEYQMQSLDKWKRTQQIDVIYYLIRSVPGNFAS